MMVAHIGPGFLARVDVHPIVEQSLLFCSRLATPCFIACFGVSVGLVYRHRLQRSNDGFGVTRHRMRRRAMAVGACALLIAVPKLLDLGASEHSAFAAAFLAIYSILVFYSAAIALLSYILPMRWSQSNAALFAAGGGLWLTGSILAFALWPPGAAVGAGELARYTIAAGPFPLLQLLGFTFVFIPLGSLLRKAWLRQQEGAFAGSLMLLGFSVSIIASATGILLGELSLDLVAEGLVKAPPRIWYFGLFGGITLIMLSGLLWINTSAFIRRSLFAVSLAGQCALGIYTAECMVVPFTRYLHNAAGVREPYGAAIALALFSLFSVFLLLKRGMSQVRALHRFGKRTRSAASDLLERSIHEAGQRQLMN